MSKILGYLTEENMVEAHFKDSSEYTIIFPENIKLIEENMKNSLKELRGLTFNKIYIDDILNWKDSVKRVELYVEKYCDGDTQYVAEYYDKAARLLEDEFFDSEKEMLDAANYWKYERNCEINITTEERNKF